MYYLVIIRNAVMIFEDVILLRAEMYSIWLMPLIELITIACVNLCYIDSAVM